MKETTTEIFSGFDVGVAAGNRQLLRAIQWQTSRELCRIEKGAIVPKAKVTLMNVDTGVTQKAASNASGVYRFDSLAPGNYTVSTTVQGFTPASVSFNLATDQTRDVPLALTVEKVASTITVTTEAPLIDTSDSRFEQTLDTTALADLPLPGRNPTNVITMAPGVTGTGGQNSPGIEHIHQLCA